MTETNPHRLSREVAPSAYRVELATDLDAATFGGSVVITAAVLERTDRIVCNSSGLDISAVTVDVGGRSITATSKCDEDTERLVMSLGEHLDAGPIQITIHFTGRLNENLVGFYRSDYTVDGEPRSMGVTQFEAPYARKAFPCWDEPEFKATFAISLVCDAALTAVSNGREINRADLGDGTVRFDFAPTMVMSTYLVAWVIGDLEMSETVRGGSTDIRVIHRPGQSHLTAFALECAAHAVTWFEEYYAIPYPGDKLDLIAVPDFAFGAMENLGCVTFRENLLLIDPERANRSEQERAATVIEHEIAHMWFGDLVTMQWWNGIWLNEAFATFMEFCCADDFRPEWEIWTSFGLSKTQAFETDALAHTRAIEFEVQTPAQAEGMFDILTYEKGASVLRMFEQWAGADKFRNGVRAYLARHAYSNTDTPDLWAALSTATGVDVASIMNTWILQGGHPLISVEPTPTGIRLHQQRSSFVGGDPTTPASWIAPMAIEAQVAGERIERSLLLDAETIEVDLGGAPDWVNANAGFGGFYRTQYSPELRTALLARVGDLSSLDRFALVDDAWALLLGGEAELSEVAATLRCVAAHDGEPSVWRRIAGVLSSLGVVTGADDRPAIAAFTESIIGDRLASAASTPSGATQSERDLRAILFRLAGTTGNVAWVIDEARTLFAGLPDSVQSDPELGAAVLDVVANHGGVADFEQLLVMYRTAATAQDELRALSALAQFPDHELTARLCEMCATEVRTQNAPFALAQAMANRVAGADVWRFVSARWDELTTRFPSSSIVRMAGGIRAFSDPDLAAEVEEFFGSHEIPQAQLTLEQHLERLRINAATRRRLDGSATDQLG